AMINGWCFGGAYGPLFACDLAYCSDDAQFGLSEINWAILPGGGASKVATELMGFRDARYHAMMGENLTGPQAAEKGMVSGALPAGKLEGAVHEGADGPQEEDRHALAPENGAGRPGGGLAPGAREDSRSRAREALHPLGGWEPRKEAAKQFRDEKTCKPGL